MECCANTCKLQTHTKFDWRLLMLLSLVNNCTSLSTGSSLTKSLVSPGFVNFQHIGTHTTIVFISPPEMYFWTGFGPLWPPQKLVENPCTGPTCRIGIYCIFLEKMHGTFLIQKYIVTPKYIVSSKIYCLLLRNMTILF